MRRGTGVHTLLAANRGPPPGPFATHFPNYPHKNTAGSGPTTNAFQSLDRKKELIRSEK